MKQDFSGLWAGGVPERRREPDPIEVAGGFPCGPLDRERDNEMNYRWFQAYRELINVIKLSGQTPDEGDLEQVWKAILAAVGLAAPAFYYGLANGTSSALVVNPTKPAIKLPYQRGAVTLVELPPSLSIATNATIRIGASGAVVNLLRNDGTRIQGGDGPAGSMLLLGFNGSNWKLLVPGQAESPKIIPGGRLYINRVTGDDNADGLTPQTALRTINGAFQTARNCYIPGDGLTFQLSATGEYPFPVGYPIMGGLITIRGDEDAQGNYILSGAGSPSSGGRGGVVEADRFNITLIGLTVRNTSTGKFTVAASAGGVLTLSYVTLTSNQTLTAAHVYVAASSAATISTGCSWLTSAANMINSAGGVISITSGAQLSVANGINFSDATAVATRFGNIIARGGSSITGNATGVRYRSNNAEIVVSGLGQNYFPGDQPGTSTGAGGYSP